MDSLTQAALGAAIGEAVLGKKVGNKGVLLGAAVATLPDLDVIFLPFFDEVQRISIHRGYSHSILGVLLLSLFLTWLLSKWKKLGDVSRQRWFVFAFLTTLTHILLDAFTTYGTQLFLPFSDYRVALDSITIIDPIYTLPLLVGVLVGLFYKKTDRFRRRWNTIGLVLSTVYLSFTLLNKSQVERVVENSLNENGIAYESYITVPVSAGNLLWYGVAKTSDGLYLGDYSALDADTEIDFTFFPNNEYLLEGISGTYLLDRMKWFSRDYYTVDEVDGKLRFYNLKCDMSGFAGEDGHAPTTFYFEIESKQDGTLGLSTGMHPKKENHDWRYKLNRMLGLKSD